jgi:uncharacterized protein (TIGR03067 family)
MRRSLLALLILGVVLSAAASAGDCKDDLIKKDRKQITGTWRIVSIEVDGAKAAEGDARKLTIINGADGVWSLRSENREVSSGISTIDPSKTPKSIDITATDGGAKGEKFLAIYEITDTTRKICFAPAGKDRPAVLISLPGSGHVLVTLQREKGK